jgi:hypothetical protein
MAWRAKLWFFLQFRTLLLILKLSLKVGPRKGNIKRRTHKALRWDPRSWKKVNNCNSTRPLLLFRCVGVPPHAAHHLRIHAEPLPAALAGCCCPPGPAWAAPPRGAIWSSRPSLVAPPSQSGSAGDGRRLRPPALPRAVAPHIYW